MIELTLTLKMTSAQVVEMSVTVNKNSPIQDYVHPDDQTQPITVYVTINETKLLQLKTYPREKALIFNVATEFLSFIVTKLR